MAAEQNVHPLYAPARDNSFHQSQVSIPHPSFPASEAQAQPPQQSQSTSSTDSRSSSPQVQHIVLTFAAMELAYKELQHTLDEATKYWHAQKLHAQHLQLHIEALREDVDLLNTYETQDDEFRNLAVQLVHAAKRMRRHLERDLVDLQIADKSSEPAEKNNSSANKLGTNLNLTPLQLPTFDSNAAQFPVYKNFFEENILNNSDLSDTGKWLRLKQSLSGHPADLVSEIPQTQHALKLAWKLLVDVYGGDERPVVDLYNKLQNLQPSTLATDRLRLTHSKLEGLIMSLEELGQDADINHFVKWTYMGKFPAEILYQVQKKKDTSLKDVRQAIGEVITARECTDIQRKTTSTKSFEQPRRTNPPASATETNKHGTLLKKPATFPKPLKCTFCEAPHWNDQCTAFATIEARREKLAGKCLKCLRNAHTTPCAEERRCYHCDSLEHNRALCPVKFGATQRTQLAIIAEDTSPQKATSTHSSGNFLTCMAKVTSDYTDKVLDVRVLLDTAGGETLATKKLVEELSIPINRDQTNYYSGLDGVPLTTSQNLRGSINLLTNEGQKIEISAAMINGTIPDVPAANIQEFRRTNPQCNAIHIPETGEGHPIELLIGSDNMVDVLKPEKINAINADTILLPTKLGYFIVGRRRQRQNQVCSSMLIKLFSNPLQQLANLDVVGLTGIEQSDIDDEEKAIQQFYATLQFSDSRYSISWPWKTYPPQLNSNFGLALGRLKSLYKRLSKSPKLLQDYHEVIQQQLRQNIIEKVTLSSTSAVTHYLPHHPILQPEKSTTVRPVIDGSSKTSSNSKSLNDNIRKGTKWLNDLVTTLLRMRKHKNVVIADIARAFHQIAINETDRDAARFLWLKNPNEPPTAENLEVFRFTRVAFGIIASPFLLHAVIQHHAAQNQSNPAVPIILQDMYADNLVAALDDDIDPKEFYSAAKKFFGSMSMNLTKWATNIKELQNFIPIDDQLQDLIQTVLGVKWNILADTLLLKQCRLPTETHPTTRTVARDMAARFDPLGWATPIILNAKIFFRNIWEKTKQWDKPLSTEDAHSWTHILKQFKAIDNIELPRRMHSLPKADRFEIHTFVDASIEAYAVVVYLRALQKNETHLTLVMAKSRLTPKKKITVPRLELIALVLGCRITTFVKNALENEEETKTFIWSDSRCAIAWMTQNKILPPIIERQVIEAKKYQVDNINYVPSELNYADVATRGTDFQTLQQMQWWIGPSWLHDAEKWPEQKQQSQPATEILFQYQQLTIKPTVIAENEIQGIATLQIADFATLNKLLTRTAYCLRALVQFKKTNFLNLQTTVDTVVSLQWWIYWDQNRIYALQNEPEAGKTFFLRNIKVFRDTEGIIRCQTRIINSCADVDTINPILLVNKSSLTKLIVLDIHIHHMHAGTSHTLANLRKKYWLPHGRREIYNIILNNCFMCRKHVAKPYATPPPAPLPEFRITRTKTPFQAIGIDICGPFYVRQTLGRNQPKQKRWILLFTCAVIRAIHLEMLKEMTTLEILLAFRRFSSRRGIPSIVISDNAPQFHQLDNCFQNIWHQLAQSNTISTYFAKNKIIWQFITETAPWMGGMYERLVRSVKLALEKTYGDIIMLERQFETTTFEIEAIINSRPIAYVDREPDSPILTPNDFLAATFTAIPIQETLRSDDDTLNKMWKSSQTYLNNFWTQWSEHYLMLLRERNDQLKPNRSGTHIQPQKGDVVVMIDISKKRSAWQTAIIERLIPGNDGKIRSAQIKLPYNTRLIRPIITLAPLKLRVDLPQISDNQLNRDRNAIIHSLAEDASQLQLTQNPDGEQPTGEETGEESSEEEDSSERGGRESDHEREAGERGSGTVPYHPNGSENGLGLVAAEPAPRETSSVAPVNPSARSVVDGPRD